jgi:hypothetical protein
VQRARQEDGEDQGEHDWAIAPVIRPEWPRKPKIYPGDSKPGRLAY